MLNTCMVYESWLSYFVPEKLRIGICMYNVNKFSGAMFMNVLRTHPHTASGGVRSQDPYYVDPDYGLLSMHRCFSFHLKDLDGYLG